MIYVSGAENSLSGNEQVQGCIECSDVEFFHSNQSFTFTPIWCLVCIDPGVESGRDKVRRIVSKNAATPSGSTLADLHPTWQALIRFCRDLDHGEIERIKIQDGLPVSAEMVKKKVKWC